MHCMMQRLLKQFTVSCKDETMRLTNEQRIELIGHINRRVKAITKISGRTATENNRARKKVMRGLIQSFSGEFGVKAERLWSKNKSLKFRGCSLYDLHEFIDCYNPPAKRKGNSNSDRSKQHRKLYWIRDSRMV